MKLRYAAGFALALLLPLCPHAAEPARTLRVGVLAFGTLNWELKVMDKHGPDRAGGVRLETTTLAGADAAKIALLGGSVDLIVADWIWAAGQREQGADLVFLPYSLNHGALTVPGNSPIRSLADLAGKRLGIAGGGLDKNWLILQAAAAKAKIPNFAKSVTPVFGAPPLLNQQLQDGKLDALLNYWNHAAKLEALGYRQILDGRGMLEQLGITAQVPALGYVFRESWAKTHGDLLNAFVKGARQASSDLCSQDAVWGEVIPLLEEPNEKVQDTLRRHYCDGKSGEFGTAERQAVAQAYKLIHESSHGQIGKSDHLPDGLFWTAE